MFHVKNPNPLSNSNRAMSSARAFTPIFVCWSNRKRKRYCKTNTAICISHVSPRHTFSATWLISSRQNLKMKFWLRTAIEREDEARYDKTEFGFELYTSELPYTVIFNAFEARFASYSRPDTAAPQNELKLSSEGNFERGVWFWH